MQNFEITLKAARVNAGLNQDDVAKAMHRSKQTIVNWEKNPGSVKFSEISKLAELYDIPVDCLKLS